MKFRLNLKTWRLVALLAAFVVACTLVALIRADATQAASKRRDTNLPTSPANLLRQTDSTFGNPNDSVIATDHSSGSLTASPANGKIVFVSDRDGDDDIYTMNSDGSGQTSLTDNSVTDTNPAYSPDGSKIVFSSYRDGDYEIYLMNSNGTDPRNLTNRPTSDYQPSFSPDGSKIVFCSNRDHGSQVYVMDLDGANLTRLTTNAATDTDPSFSRDGSKIVFTSDRSGNSDIYVMDADGANQINLSSDPGFDSAPAFSPDGSKIIFSSTRNGGWDIYTVNSIDGSSLTNVSNNGIHNSDPTYSPDGSKIVFLRLEELVVMDANGTNQTVLTSNTSVDREPNWQPLTEEIRGLTINDVSVAEPASGTIAATFTVTLSAPSLTSVTVDYATKNDTATAPTDYLSIPTSQLVFGPNETTKTISVAINSDAAVETLEIFSVVLSSPVNAVLVDGVGRGGILTQYHRNGKLVVQNINQERDLYVTDSAGGNRTNITNSAFATDAYPSFSPDGSKIVFESNGDSNSELYLVNTDGSGLAQVTNTANPTGSYHPSFSPDGSRIVFIRTEDFGNAYVCTITVSGADLRCLANTAGSSHPSFSPDGRKIVFESLRNYINEIYVMDVDGSHQVRLTNNSLSSTYDYRPTFSPDGSKIVYQSTGAGLSQIYSMNADGSGQANLSNSATNDYYPAFSPDGRIVYSSYRNGDAILAMDTDGNHQTVLYTSAGGTDEFPSWQPVTEPQCSFAVSPLVMNFDGDRNNGSFTVTPSQTSCSWSASTNDAWIHAQVDGHTGGTFTLIFPIDVNSGAARTGSITVAGHTITVNQAAGVIDVLMPSFIAQRNTTLTVPLFVLNTHSTTGHGIISYDFTVAYDTSVLGSIGSYTKVGTLSSGMEITVNSSQPGELHVSGFGLTPLSGSGILLYLNFQVMDDPGVCGELDLHGFQFNDGFPVALTTSGEVCITSTVSGAVTYANAPQTVPVPNVTLTAVGSETFATTTATDGSYSLNQFGGGHYTVTPTKAGEINNAVSALDASLAARYSVHLSPLTVNQQLAADVSGNGSVNSYDAALIAQFASNIANPGNAGIWKFMPASRTYDDLEVNLTGENYLAILMGDVTGNWTAPNPLAGRAQLRSQPDANAVAVGLPTLNAARNQSIIVPVSIGDVTNRGFLAYDLEITYDPAVLQVDSTNPVDTTGTISNQLSVAANPNEPGRLRVTAYGVNVLQGSGLLLNLHFRVIGLSGQVSPLAFQRLVFNEDPTQSSTHDGQLTVQGPTAAAVEVGGRICTANGNGIRSVIVTMTDPQGNVKTTLSSSFGYYRFSGVSVGAIYTFTVSAKRFTFGQPTQVISIGGQSANINFVAEN